MAQGDKIRDSGRVWAVGCLLGSHYLENLMLCSC